jgi:hypothetical protein
MLEYSKWQQKKNNRRHLYPLSLGEEMLTPHIRSRAYSGKIDRHTCRAMRAMCVAYEQPASPTTAKKGGGRQQRRCV